MPKGPIIEECMQCGKDYELYSKGTLSAETFDGVVPEGPHKGFAVHSHLELCSTCSKPVLSFIRRKLGKNKSAF